MTGPAHTGNGGRPLDVVGVGALNVDWVVPGPRSGSAARVAAPGSTGSHEAVDDPSAGDSETVVRSDQIAAEVGDTQGAPLSFLGGSAFNSITMLAQLGLAGVRLGFVGVPVRPAHGVMEGHIDRFTGLGVELLCSATASDREGDLLPGLCYSRPSHHERELLTTPEGNLAIASYLQQTGVRQALRSARILHVTSFLEDPAEVGSVSIASAVARCIADAKRDHPSLILSFDPGQPWVERHLIAPLRALYRVADVLFLNDREYERVAGEPVEAPGRLAGSLAQLCAPDAVIVAKRAREVIVRQPVGAQMRRVAQRQYVEEAVDPTGAGDAVAAGVLAALATGRGIVEGCELGLRIAALRVADYGDRGHRRLAEQLARVERAQAGHGIERPARPL